jgi:CheY-like chemotaxis protein
MEHRGEAVTRVLVVDDDPDVAELLAEVFRGAGDQYAVDIAGDGPAALVAAGRQRPDVVLMDIGMPGMNGVEVLKVLRNRDLSIQVIMVSAGAGRLYVEHLVQAASARPAGRVRPKPGP